MAIATLVASGSVLAGVVPANAAVVHEITARWAEEPPETVRSGDVLNAEWRVNVNDDRPAPSNDPVENVTVTLTLDNGVFDELPDSCLVEGVNPASSISEDGRTLVCNIGTQDEGTAHVLQTPIRADGPTGALVTARGTIGDAAAELPPVEIVNEFGMDMAWGTPSSNGPMTATYADLDFQWTLFLKDRSEPGPDSVSYRISVSAANGSTVTLAPGACGAFTSGTAPAHPWSGGDNPAEATAPFVDSCTLTPVAGAPGQFTLTLTGIDYSLAQAPTLDSAGDPLRKDAAAVASGQVVFRVASSSNTGVTLTASAPTYTGAVSGAQATDDASNNTSTKAIVRGAGESSAWVRNFTNSGGTSWDDSYRVAPGTVVQQRYTVDTSMQTADPGSALWGVCEVFDSRYVDFVSAASSGIDSAAYPMQYYVGTAPTVDPASASYNPNAFSCGAGGVSLTGGGGWVTTPPADLSTVKAVRAIYPASEARRLPQREGISALVRIKDDVQPGQDIWSWGTGLYNGRWSNWNEGVVTPVSGARYSNTNAYRDILRIVVALPTVEKSADRASVKPGEEATFTLAYSANGEGGIPETVDGYLLVDTLPIGMNYVPGSADPEPAVTTNASGQQVLTWTLDGVPTNATQSLSYRAAAAANAPAGQVLTNSVTASLGGARNTDTAQVTISTNGYTAIGKTADMAYVPNLAGDGVGEGSWTVTLRSYDPLAQAFTDTIDILPFNGDARGTDFAGAYSLSAVNAAAGATVYYTTADPASLSDDPADDAHGAAGDPAGNTVGWSTTFTPAATAVRVIGPELAPGATQQFQVVFETDGAEGGDVLVNRAQARDEHTELVMRTSAPITVANYYSASIKKYVKDIHAPDGGACVDRDLLPAEVSDGCWRDANDVTDYPTFLIGDSIEYLIAVQNTGQGTLTNVVIEDDEQPELGSFTIDELAPGEMAFREFSIVADASMEGGVVNTACGAADVPSDSQVAPTINCDPAGFEVDGEPQHTKELVSAEPIGNGQWRVVYGIDVINASPYGTQYSLDDTLHFTEQVEIVSATVTGSPAGVPLADPAWDGAENTRISTDVPLAGNDDEGYAAHRYEVTVIADVPLQFDGTGTDEDPTVCGGGDSDSAFNNVSELTDRRGNVEQDEACATPPSIDIRKTVADGPAPNGDGTWTIVYDIVAVNDGSSAGEYDMTDRMTAGGDMIVDSGRVISAPDGVAVSESWTGLGEEGAAENVIATDVTLPAGASHTYRVEVVISLDTTDGVPAVTSCEDATTGGDGGLSNTASIVHNDLTDESSACVTVAVITVEKTVASGPTPRGDGTWRVVYEIVAENVGAATGDYDVYDRLSFGDSIVIEEAVVSGPEGVTLAAGWTGLGEAPDASENLIAESVSLDEDAAHTYQVEVIVSLVDDVDPDTLACQADGSAGGLLNGTVLDHNGMPVTDAVCPEITEIVVDKEISAGPTGNGDGTWTIVYDLVATNVGPVAGEYDIADELRFGDGIEVASAEVVTVPEGVEVETAWNGRGTNTIAEGVSLEAESAHTYQVRAVVSLDVDTVTPGDLACSAAGSGENGGLANSVELDHNGRIHDDEVCAELPLVDIAKSLSGAVAPVEGEEGVYDATYEILVSNRGPAATTYDLDDRLSVGEGVTVVGVQGVSTDAPDSVGVNPSFGTDGDERIVTAQPIAGADAAAVVHRYLVTIRYGLDLSAVVNPVPDTCEGAGGGTPEGALHNSATVSWNGIVDEDDACVLPSKPTLDKKLVSAEPTGEGTWTVDYDLTVGNTGGEPTRYDLDDEFLFAEDVTVRSVALDGPDGVSVNEAFDGDAEQRIATDVTIAGLDDEGYTAHVYRVTVVVDVPLHFGETDADGNGSPACTLAPGGNLLRQGLNNAATLTDETGGTQTDTDCAALPSIDITKSVVGAPVQDTNGQWIVEYEIDAVNDGARDGAYIVTDRLRYGAGVTVVAAEVASSPEGVTVSEAWTGRGAEGADENTVASGTLPAGATHTYRVVVVSELDVSAADGSTLACPAPGTDERGGFANTAGLTHNGLADRAVACDVPEWPPHEPLPSTGGTMPLGALGIGVALLIAGALLVVARRRRTASRAGEGA